MEKTKYLTRTCASCGLEKPISAFLQISGSHGTIYGSVCATCRSREDRKPQSETEDDRSTIPTGQRIGAKEKAFLDKEQFRQFQDKKMQDRKDRQKKEMLSDEKSDRIIQKEKDILKHRKNYLENKTNFLIGKKLSQGERPPTAFDTKTTATQQAREQNIIVQKISEAETRKVSTDFSSAISHPIQSRAEFHSSTFLRFKALLGNAPIAEIMGKFSKTSNEKMAKKVESNEKKEERLMDFTRKSWGPKGR